MGWWSATVLGGDLPLDVMGDLTEAAKMPAYDDEGAPIAYPDGFEQKQIEKHMQRLVEVCDNYADPVAYQVLGALIITTGAKMPARVKTLVLNGISADEWAASGDPERKRFMNNFRRQIKRYPINARPARPRSLAQEGLFDKLADMLENGDEGLLNKNR